ncbi:MAG: tetratricopeptide repeat protein [Acidobacteria bacterium]|nr:MAG: tetratricopeptide repeat protein [Acidobacteriota bacterium]
MVRWLSLAALVWAAPASGEDCQTAFAGTTASPEYISLVEAYRRGRPLRLGAVRAAARLGHEALEPFVKQLDPARMGPCSHPCIEAMALLHTDTAIHHVENGAWPEAFGHFELGQKLSRKVGQRFQRDWALAVALYYQGRIFAGDEEIGFREATALFDDAVDLYPADTEILVAAGAVWEWSGSLPRGESGHLKRAERLYARALEQEPRLAEAKLRYGKVLEKRGHFEEAVQRLEELVALEADHHIIYRARMALGNLAERRGLPEAAIRHYRAAIELEPDWQIGYLALSHALHTTSEREASRAALEEALLLSDSTQSSWWEYELGMSERAEPLLSSLREALAH